MSDEERADLILAVAFVTDSIAVALELEQIATEMRQRTAEDEVGG